ncbi:MAG: hypothetical protein EXS17_04885 [Phycisphaerales bacterium]|nr:hypothetical protein [Phycisphaerales bacterium]
MTSFFEHQDRAQSATLWLVVLFLFGAFGVTAAITLLMALFIPNSVPLAIGVSALMIAIPFFFKLSTVGSGGAVVAQSLGGTRIDPASRDPHERKILNIVEEMAIASGMPVPPVYVLDEECINAFAAGTLPSNAVIGVSRGAIETLTRDELQGVMAHEFSHIFHGDMRINMRAIAAIFSVMAVGYIGYFILRTTMYSPRTSRRSDGKATAGIALLGIGLIVVGCIGTFFGRLMQAAISRQREFLADASAVQYTRNPAGIAGALAKIAQQSSGAMHHAEASQFNHMLFAEGVSTLFASHPPLPLRIERIRSMAGGVLAQAPITSPAQCVASVGSIDAIGLARIASGHASLSAPLDTAIHDSHEAEAVVLLCAQSEDATKSALQRALIVARAPELALVFARLESEVSALGVETRLELVDRACATLVVGSTESYKHFRTLLSDSIRVDGTIDLLEWTITQVLRTRVEVPLAARGGVSPPTRRASLDGVAANALRILGLLALQGHDDDAAAANALRAGLKAAGLPEAGLPNRLERTLDSIATDLDALEKLRPSAAGILVNAAAICVSTDQQTTAREYLLLRAISERLGIPMPPIP